MRTDYSEISSSYLWGELFLSYSLSLLAGIPLFSFSHSFFRGMYRGEHLWGVGGLLKDTKDLNK